MSVLAALAVAAATLAFARAEAVFGPDVFHVGAAQRDITPDGVVNLGGNGLGDGRLLPQPIVGRGRTGAAQEERIQVRAMVVDDGFTAVAVASIETQGMFAAYRDGAYGLVDIANEVAARRSIDVPGEPGLAPSHILISADHSHSAPDTIGAWGYVPEQYMAFVKEQAVQAIVEAYDNRRPARVVAGGSEARDLVYNQNCTEALNQNPEPVYTGPAFCNVPDQDVMDARLRVLQARDVETGEVVATLVSYAAHATLGGAPGLHGDWPQFLSDELAERYGGVGIAVQGAVGRVQPCRSKCAHTRPGQPGYDLTDRKAYYTTALMAHVEAGLASARQVVGVVRGARTIIREPITSPAVLALFAGGEHAGADLRRSREAPWATGTVLGTPVTSLRIGNVLLSGFPGEAYPNIAVGVAGAVGNQIVEHVPVGLANDQVGYLIAPAEAYPMVAAEVAVNDNSIFNVSQTIGDHVMCASIVLADRMGLWADTPPRCLAFPDLPGVQAGAPGFSGN